MRFTLVSSFALVLPALVGCGGSGPLGADAAWIVNMDAGNSGTCIQGANKTEQMGGLTATEPLDRTYNGQASPSDMNETATILCSVTGSSTFAVSGKASTPEKSLIVSIPMIAANASATSPATGSVSFAAATFTANNPFESSACSFYFKNTTQGIKGGEIWASFVCPSVESGGDTCELTESFFLFERCAGGM